MPTPLPTFLLFALASLTPLAAQTKEPTDPWPAFAKLPIARQQAAAAEFLTLLPSLPHVDALRALAAEADAPAKPRAKVGTVQRPKRVLEYPREPDPLFRRVDYVFGLGTVEPRGTAAAKPGTDAVVLHHALTGLAPNADKALAALLRRLDTDTAGDDFAAFLHAWRNGDESFYEALDRTAGSKDSVFFYDVMLGDFRTHFAKGEHKLAGSLQQAHDALHDAFLAYRQYRGFREAVAWSLVLPPDVPLPLRLRRYEDKPAGSYSLRQQITMVAAALDHDLAGLVDAIAKEAPPLSRPIWAKAHDPYPPWNARFAALQPKMIERAGSTDAFLQRAETALRDEAAGLRKLASAHLATLAGGKAH
ncbi:MAG: hypothetical protein JNK15_25945 [Planctomycetes bacterium]|nr:hypothetical protein [Planctomycetota bacterium]